MKHLLNNLSEEEKNSIRGQHTGGMKVSNDRFNSLLENKLGNSKPLVEQFDDEDDYDFEDEFESDENEPYIDLTDKEDDDIHQIHRNMSSDDEELDEDTSWMDDLNEELADNEESIGNKLSILFKKKGKKMSKEMDVNEFAEEVVDICHGRSDYKYEKEWFFNGEVYGILRNIYKLSEEDAVGLYIKILDDVDSKIHN